MNRLILVVLVVGSVACGDNTPPPPLGYTDPGPGGALRLIQNPATTDTVVVLDLVVGDQALTGYSAGFDLALDATRVTLTAFTPGTALSPGSEPVAARAMIATTGPLAGMLVAGQSHKAAGAGAVTTDTTLAPGTVLFTLTLELAAGATTGVGVVFDGTVPGYVLASGGLRDRAGLTIVDPTRVSIGKLEAYVAAP